MKKHIASEYRTALRCILTACLAFLVVIFPFNSCMAEDIPYGELKILEAGEDAGAEYQDKIIFLVDSTFVGLRDLHIIPNQVWATENRVLPIGNASKDRILVPPDFITLETPKSAIMPTRPKILVIGIGTDGLTEVDARKFESEYIDLVYHLMFFSSGDTQIICCGLPSVTAGYNGEDGLTAEAISEANEWVKWVCRDTGAYFLDVQEALCENGELLEQYSADNGKTLNEAGLQAFLTYVRTHPIPEEAGNQNP